MSRPVFLPQTLADLWEALEKNPGARIYGGGTDLLVALRAGRIDAPALVCLERVEALRGVREREDRLVIGAATSMTQLLENPVICRHLPVLSQALRVLGSPLIRHAATLGGNICTASPAGDTLPPLFVLDAVLELRSARCVRQVPIAEFIRGPGKTILEPGEILAAVEVPKPSAFNRHHFEKVGRRKALACSVASLAALLAVSDEGVVETVRLAWGSVGPTVVTSPQVEGILTGKRLEAASLQEAAKAAEAAVSPIDDLRAGAAYRRRVAGNLLFRFLDGRMGDPTAPGVSS